MNSKSDIWESDSEHLGARAGFPRPHSHWVVLLVETGKSRRRRWVPVLDLSLQRDLGYFEGNSALTLR